MPERLQRGELCVGTVDDVFTHYKQKVCISAQADPEIGFVSDLCQEYTSLPGHGEMCDNCVHRAFKRHYLMGTRDTRETLRTRHLEAFFSDEDVYASAVIHTDKKGYEGAQESQVIQSYRFPAR